MCIFCGGTCGGAGDMLLPALATGGGLVILKIQAKRELKKNQAKPETKPASPDNIAD
ncbi:hypothetical protein [Dehalococcoides mccartyi]|uniref:hypothetical protein n=1 Tax=Dehalococcoides mccartyi TaxID=61435 RepID=UPI0015E6623E|nr:hypothetical protein [Dehalococcoides mccartyi]